MVLNQNLNKLNKKILKNINDPVKEQPVLIHNPYESPELKFETINKAVNLDIESLEMKCNAFMNLNPLIEKIQNSIKNINQNRETPVKYINRELFDDVIIEIISEAKQELEILEKNKNEANKIWYYFEKYHDEFESLFFFELIIQSK